MTTLRGTILPYSSFNCQAYVEYVDAGIGPAMPTELSWQSSQWNFFIPREIRLLNLEGGFSPRILKMFLTHIFAEDNEILQGDFNSLSFTSADGTTGQWAPC